MRLAAIVLVVLAAPVLAQGRGNPWERMKRLDADKDGKISREEFPGPDQRFDRMDADGDGFVTEADRERRRRGGGSEEMARRFDTDNDKQVSNKEWQAFFAKADKNGDGSLDAAELRAALSGRAYHDPAPKEGAAIPKVSAKRAKGDGVVDLGKLRRTTVLVFGSWT